MLNEKKLEKIYQNIMTSAEAIKVLSEHLIAYTEGGIEKDVLAQIIFEKAYKISMVNEKLGLMFRF